MLKQLNQNKELEARAYKIVKGVPLFMAICVALTIYYISLLYEDGYLQSVQFRNIYRILAR